MSINISSIYFSPVKSISFQQISKCQIKKNIGIVNDRLFAFSRLLESKKAKRMEQDPSMRKLSNFLTLKNTPVLNKYSFEFNKGKLELFKNKEKLFSINPNNLDAIKLIETPIFLLKNKNEPFFDTNSGGEVMNSISLINHNSIKDIEEKINQKVEHQRFRGNFYIEGLPPWEERNLLGKIIKIGGLPFKIDDNTKMFSD